MGDAEARHFYDFEIWGRVRGSHNKLFLSLERPRHLNEAQADSKIMFGKSCFYKFENV